MRYSASLTLVAAAIVAMFSAAPAHAEDYRIQIKHPKQDPTAFCNTWRSDCINYVPENPALYFQATLCEPGDYSGKYPYHIARVVCLFTDGETTTSIIHHIAKETGSTIVPPTN